MAICIAQKPLDNISAMYAMVSVVCLSGANGDTISFSNAYYCIGFLGFCTLSEPTCVAVLNSSCLVTVVSPDMMSLSTLQPWS